ncbi:MAG: helix-turn-helix domain-containing protein [Candidatus Contendobacter sp.]|nr:helix-turn-helix domain-containing protein [Candidatus Contendobacter sp.]MDS4059900.1 helix-turn-helix domain-containing protein [Candidatus Contendobacter sp.]
MDVVFVGLARGGAGHADVRRLLARGELPAVRIGTRLLIPADAVRDWIDRQTVTYAQSSVEGLARGTGPCPNEKTKTASTSAGTPHSGGPATPTQAARELATVLKLPIERKPRPC